MENDIIGFCASIVTFNPDIEILNKNIFRVFKQVKVIYLFDNGSSNANEIRNLINIYDNISFYFSSKNEGLSCALNKNCEKALSNGFKWILLLDQDSIIDSHLIEEYSKYIADGVGQITSYHTDRNVNDNFRNLGDKVSIIEWCITSGTLMNLEIWNNVNRFDDSLFIDSIDVDYGITLKEKRYKTIQIPFVGFTHEVGKISKVITLFGIKHPVYNYSSFRKYYIYRNAIYVSRKHKTKSTFKTTLKVLSRIIFEFFLENNRIKNLKSSLKGVRDAFKMEVK